jgi:predicted ATPase
MINSVSLRVGRLLDLSFSCKESGAARNFNLVVGGTGSGKTSTIESIEIDAKIRNLRVRRISRSFVTRPHSGGMLEEIREYVKDHVIFQGITITQDEFYRMSKLGVPFSSGESGFLEVLRDCLHMGTQQPHIVLLDDIELHLSPILQQEVLRLLQGLADGGHQVFATTISDHCIAVVPENCIVRL